MKFALFYEIPVAKPWNDRSEYWAYQHTLEQAILGDRLGFQKRQQFLRRHLFAWLFGSLFQNRIFDDFLGDHLLQLQPVELENGDHLHQARGENLLLCDLKLQSGRQ